MATLTGEQLKDSYQSLVTIGDSITSDPTSGVLENGKGTPITDITIGGDITIADKIIHSGDTNTAIRFPANDTVTIETAGLEAMRIDSSGNVEINGSAAPLLSVKSTASGTPTAFVYASTNGADFGSLTNHPTRFYVNNGEKMRIDSSGTVMVGKTATGLTNIGVELFQSGGITATRSGDVVQYLNRTTSDGSILEFRKDNTAVGSIGSRTVTGGSASYIQLGLNGEGLAGSNLAIIGPANGGSLTDGVLDLGASGARFKDIYATNGTIQTSDRNEKQDIEELNDAELRVAQKAKTLLRKYRWKSSVEEKGDDARIHFGIIAQDLEQAFTDEGLDVGRYGMFIKSTWTNEEGEEQTRLGVRYNQLLAFIISAL